MTVVSKTLLTGFLRPVEKRVIQQFRFNNFALVVAEIRQELEEIRRQRRLMISVRRLGDAADGKCDQGDYRGPVLNPRRAGCPATDKSRDQLQFQHRLAHKRIRSHEYPRIPRVAH